MLVVVNITDETWNQILSLQQEAEVALPEIRTTTSDVMQALLISALQQRQLLCQQQAAEVSWWQRFKLWCKELISVEPASQPIFKVSGVLR